MQQKMAEELVRETNKKTLDSQREEHRKISGALKRSRRRMTGERFLWEVLKHISQEKKKKNLEVQKPDYTESGKK